MVPRGVGEELVQEEGLLTSQHEQRLRETGPPSTDLHKTRVNMQIYGRNEDEEDKQAKDSHARSRKYCKIF